MIDTRLGSIARTTGAATGCGETGDESGDENDESDESGASATDEVGDDAGLGDAEARGCSTSEPRPSPFVLALGGLLVWLRRRG